LHHIDREDHARAWATVSNLQTGEVYDTDLNEVRTPPTGVGHEAGTKSADTGTQSASAQGGDDTASARAFSQTKCFYNYSRTGYYYKLKHGLKSPNTKVDGRASGRNYAHTWVKIGNSNHTTYRVQYRALFNVRNPRNANFDQALTLQLGAYNHLTVTWTGSAWKVEGTITKADQSVQQIDTTVAPTGDTTSIEYQMYRVVAKDVPFNVSATMNSESTWKQKGLYQNGPGETVLSGIGLLRFVQAIGQ
jgi:hypothetical protein